MIITLGRTAYYRRSNCYSHSPRASIIISHGCGDCAIAVQVGGFSGIPEADFRIQDRGRSGKIGSLIHNNDHRGCRMSRGNASLKPAYSEEIRLCICAFIGTFRCRCFGYC